MDAGIEKLKPGKLSAVIPVPVTVVTCETATCVQGATVTSVEAPDKEVALKYSSHVDPFSAVVHQLEIAVKLTANGLVLSSTKVTLDGPPSELPPL